MPAIARPRRPLNPARTVERDTLAAYLAQRPPAVVLDLSDNADRICRNIRPLDGVRYSDFHVHAPAWRSAGGAGHVVATACGEVYAARTVMHTSCQVDCYGCERAIARMPR